MYIFDHIQKLILVPMVVTTVTSGCMRGWQRRGTVWDTRDRDRRKQRGFPQCRRARPVLAS